MQDRYSTSIEIIPVSLSNHTKILLTLYKAMATKPFFLIFFGACLVFFGLIGPLAGGLSYKTGLITGTILILGFYLIFPMLGVVVVYLRAKSNKKKGFRKTGVLSDIDFE